MKKKMKRIVFWNNYGSSGSKYVLERFSEEGHGAIFSDEGPFPVAREASIVTDFLDGDVDTLLFMTRDRFVSDLVVLLAGTRVEVKVLPEWDAVKFDPDWLGGSERVLNLEEEFEALLGSMGSLKPYEVTPAEEPKSKS